MRLHVWHHTRQHPTSITQHAQRKIAERLAAREFRHEPTLAHDRGPAQFEAACRSLTTTSNESISRISVVLPYPEGFDGTIAVMEYAHALADEFGLHVCCNLGNTQIAITFERAGTND